MHLGLFITTVIKSWQKEIAEVLKIIKIIIIAEHFLKPSLGYIDYNEKKTRDLQPWFAALVWTQKKQEEAKIRLRA